MLYEKSNEILKGLYKSASFVVQAICFIQTGKYISRQKDLLKVVSENERVIINNFMKMKNGDEIRFEEMSEALFSWSKGWLK